ncbi:MAG: hypothetical protein JSU87_11870 [Gemmatimonadota bacterium]|nr:MAG: hypothetical protein JSU87_11870 [Gemmatimonadota bacterium]
MHQLEHLHHRLEVTERRVRRLSALAVLLGVLALIGAIRPPDDVLRARGLVITDAEGRERIVLGAPLHEASADEKLAQTVGLVVLDSLGRLNVSVGANNPLVLADGRIGTRIAGDAGMIIYDPRNGAERGGFGALSDGRANLCLDYGTRPKEAACLSVAPGDQYAAVILNGTPNEDEFDRVTMYVGADGTGALKAFGGGANTGGVLIRAGKGPASITVYDTTGTAIGDIARRP